MNNNNNKKNKLQKFLQQCMRCGFFSPVLFTSEHTHTHTQSNGTVIEWENHVPWSANHKN